QIRRRAEEKAKEAELARNAASVLKDKGISFVAKVAKTGKLFGAISPKMIAEALTEQLQVEVPEANIALDEHIKTVGDHKAMVKIGAQELELKIVVKAE
ncbi:MAG: 50S ribosomal L9 C-terminal domain-containing protein, partial [Patescibacteria group bacterium]